MMQEIDIYIRRIEEELQATKKRMIGFEDLCQMIIDAEKADPYVREVTYSVWLNKARQLKGV